MKFTMQSEKRVAIVQSNYIPWKGYFDLIASVDDFILYDQVQFTKNDWRNRNKVKSSRGLEWLTIPVGQDIKRRICEVFPVRNDWRSKHWKTLTTNYGRAPHFSEIAEILGQFYLSNDVDVSLSETNRITIQLICNYLRIQTKIKDSLDFNLPEGKVERLVDLCKQTDATTYVSGPAAKEYIDERKFNEAGISVEWFDYSGYPVYPQIWGGFEHGVSIVDLLFNCGSASRKYMKISMKEK